MKLGTNEPKKVILLGGLVLVAGYLLYSNLVSDTPNGAAPAKKTATTAEAPAELNAPSSAARPSAPRAAQTRGRADEWRPVLRSKRPEERIDPTKIDPTLRLDLLAKLQQVEVSGPGRNLFQTGAPAPVKPLSGPEPKVTLTKATPPPTEPVKPAGPPPPPPINLRYYGYTSAPGAAAKTAFFLDGEDILVAKEGETLKRRYKLVRIGVNSVLMEDTESKHQQTIPLAEEAT